MASNNRGRRRVYDRLGSKRLPKKGWQRHCKSTGKASYATRHEATTALTYVRAKGGRAVKPERVYRCEWCGNWHLTSQERHYGGEQKEVTDGE